MIPVFLYFFNLFMEFYCKQFSLNHSKSTMKVGTDSILLSSIVADYYKEQNKETVQNIMDIGTGCGIIALCMAQIFHTAKVLAIDIDSDSIVQARENFQSNKWKERMFAECVDLKDFALHCEKKFDLLVSNPPYFTNSLLSPIEQRNLARHNFVLSIEDFVASTSKIASLEVKIAVILPQKEMSVMEELFAKEDFFISRRYDIYTRKDKTTIPKRVVAIFERKRQKTIVSSIFIRDSFNEYTLEFKNLCNVFLL